MDPIIITPRLKLTLVTKAERNSPELEWLHELRSNEQATWWSISPRSQSIEDTEKVIKGYLPTDEGEVKMYRVVYAVHKILQPTNQFIEGKTRPDIQGEPSAEFIGQVTLIPLEAGSLVLPEDLTPALDAKTTLAVELGYSFLPAAWGKGYATESLEAVFTACERATPFWLPFSKLQVRAIVNGLNPPSLRVMAKSRMKKLGVFDLTTKPIFLGGEWREEHNLHIYGMQMLE